MKHTERAEKCANNCSEKSKLLRVRVDKRGEWQSWNYVSWHSYNWFSLRLYNAIEPKIILYRPRIVRHSAKRYYRNTILKIRLVLYFGRHNFQSFFWPHFTTLWMRLAFFSSYHSIVKGIVFFVVVIVVYRYFSMLFKWQMLVFVCEILNIVHIVLKNDNLLFQEFIILLSCAYFYTWYNWIARNMGLHFSRSIGCHVIICCDFNTHTFDKDIKFSQ